MKNKKMTIVLILSVSAVWGIIFYKLFSASGGDDTYVLSATVAPPAYESLDDYKLKDSFKLQLNYRDPFLGKQVRPDTAASSGLKPASTQIPVRPVISKPPVNWGAIKYTGYITNPANKRIVSILTINNKEYMLSDGEAADGLKLVKSFKDSVKVSYQQSVKNINISRNY